MKAYVCDKCGKVILLEDERPYLTPSGIYHLTGEGLEIELCENCKDELLTAIRTVKGE